MADRRTLHFNHLEDFREWLIKNNWEMKPLSKSQYEVLRATKDGRWVIVYIKDSATEHYSLTDNSISVVNQWLKELKIRKQVCSEIIKTSCHLIQNDGSIIYQLSDKELALIEKSKFVDEQ